MLAGKKKAFGKEIILAKLFCWYRYPDDEIDPEDVDEDESVSLGEESPRAKDGVESGSEGIERAADESVKNAAEL